MADSYYRYDGPKDSSSSIGGIVIDQEAFAAGDPGAIVRTGEVFTASKEVVDTYSEEHSISTVSKKKYQEQLNTGNQPETTVAVPQAPTEDGGDD